MPWKECNRMDERLRFVAKLLDGEKMSAVWREFGISRKTGYKTFSRYKDFGLRGLEGKARSPYRHPNKTPIQVEKAILQIKRELGRAKDSRQADQGAAHHQHTDSKHHPLDP